MSAGTGLSTTKTERASLIEEKLFSVTFYAVFSFEQIEPVFLDMKELKSFSLLLVLFTALCSCKKDDGLDPDFEKSYAAWQGFKSSWNNSYEYSVVTQSFSGYKTETILTVKEGQVIRRAFLGKYADGSGPVVSRPEERWTEELIELGSHQGGAALLTLDEVYARVKQQWLSKDKDVKMHFQVSNQGMISTAGYTPKGCMDDCFAGIKIGFIRKL